MGLRFSWKMCFYLVEFIFAFILLVYSCAFCAQIFSFFFVLSVRKCRMKKVHGDMVCIVRFKNRFVLLENCLFAYFFGIFFRFFCWLPINTVHGNIFEMPTFRIAHYQHGSRITKKKNKNKRSNKTKNYCIFSWLPVVWAVLSLCYMYTTEHIKYFIANFSGKLRLALSSFLQL